MAHPLITKFDIYTATFEGDSNIPGTAYGEDVEVIIRTHRDDGDPRSTTVSIGDNMFTVDQIQRILDNVKKHDNAIKAFGESNA